LAVLAEPAARRPLAVLALPPADRAEAAWLPADRAELAGCDEPLAWSPAGWAEPPPWPPAG